MIIALPTSEQEALCSVDANRLVGNPSMLALRSSLKAKKFNGGGFH